jgi:hypothetical protein
MQELPVHRFPNVVPDRGNPMRPVVLLLAAAFGVMLVAFPAGMVYVGLGTAGTVSVALLIVVVAAICVGVVLTFARTYDRDRQTLLAGEAWARWRIDAGEQQRFVGRERTRSWRLAAAYALGGVALGVIFGLAGDWLTGGILIGAFLLATLVILLAGGPPRAARTAQADEVWVGPKGVYFLGHYMPLNATGTRATSVRLEPGNPAALLFGIRSGNRVEELRVPVPHAHLAEAAVLVERFRRELNLGG